MFPVVVGGLDLRDVPYHHDSLVIGHILSVGYHEDSDSRGDIVW